MAGSPRALVVAYDFPPHAAIGTMRTLRVVQQLARSGWDVTVLTSDPRTFRPGTPADLALLERVPTDVRIVRAPVFRGFESIKGMLKWSARAGARPKSGTTSAATQRAPRRAGAAKRSKIGRASCRERVKR